MQDELKKLVSVSSWLVALQIVAMIAFVVSTRLLYTDIQSLRQTLSEGRSNYLTNTSSISEWQETIRPHNAIVGPDNAQVIVVEFTDFQCPFCIQFRESTRDKIIAKYGSNLRYVVKHFPLEEIHQQARQAAIVAQCAGREGRFWEVETFLFERKGELSPGSIRNIVQNLNVSPIVEKCIQDEATSAEVDQDVQDGVRLGVRGTPSFVINGRLVPGAIPLAKFESLIGEALEEK